MSYFSFRNDQQFARPDLNVHSFLKTKLSSFKVAKEYVVIEDMPKTSAGKIPKRELRKRLIDGNG